MGTSKSGTGPGPGVPLTPPWVPDPVPAAPPADGGGDGTDGADGQNNPDTTPPPPAAPSLPAEIAPARRFGAARTNMGSFARSGSHDEMRRGLGHYVRKGYSGSGATARRMGGTARAAGALYGALSSAAAGQPAAPGSPFDPALLAGRSADEIMDALVEAVRPVDGTQDAEAGRDAIKAALSELLEQHPDANLLDLSEEQRLFAIERYISRDVFNRIVLDIGKSIQDNAPSASAGLSRLKEISDYVRETVAGRFRSLRKAGEQLDARRVSQLVNQALQEAFSVFEDYVA